MYYGVVYCKDSTIHLFSADTKDKVSAMLFDLMKDKRVYDRVERTTIIKRNTNSAYVFGCPLSLDMKSKFDKMLKRHKVEFIKG